MGEASEKHEKLELVIRSLKRTRNKLGCGFILILAIGVAAVLGGIFSDEASAAIIGFGVFCLLLAALGVKIIWPNLNPVNSPLMKLLVERRNQVVSREEILERVWGYRFSTSSRTIDNFIARLRAKFEPDPDRPRFFLTVRGVGYRFEPNGRERD